MRRLRAVIASVALAAGVAASPAAALDRVVTIGSAGPGPTAYDKVFVHQMGPEDADRVLVLMPGLQGGAGDFTLVGKDLLRRVDDLQVWAVDRRSQALEDTTVFEQALAGERTPQQMFDYYLGWLVNGGVPSDHFDFLDPATAPFARNWGMKTAIDDARRVVLAARKRGREVILGGHSLGASLTAAYAAWDFNGRPGYRDLDGLVLIDGGLLGSFDGIAGLAEAKRAIAELETSNPFLDLLETGIPETTGLFAEVAGVYAKLDPTAAATTLQDYPLLPAEFRPPVTVTTRALFGHAFDRDTSPSALGLLHVNAGHLAASGEPRDWVDGGVTPIARLVDLFAQEPSNGAEWYFPKRLTIDTDGADPMKMNRIARFLGLRLEHTAEIDVPIYAIQTDLAGAHVLRGARRLIERARTTAAQSRLVDADPQNSHLDPLTAAPGKNRFLRTVAPFVDAIGR